MSVCEDLRVPFRACLPTLTWPPPSHPLFALLSGSLNVQMMNNPMVQNMMSNPDTLRSILQSNPQMQSLMESNPEVRAALNNPEILRQSMEAMRNPELMREMMRNTDRAMSNIEAHPEGFNALRRMYTEVQEPMMEAAANTNPFAGLFGEQAGQPASSGDDGDTTSATDTQNTPLANPWAPRPAASHEGTASPAATGSNPFAGIMGLGGRSAPGGFGGAAPGGGLGAGLSGMPPGMPSLESMSQMMQDPMIQQMMTSMMSNPEVMNQAVNSNPHLRQMVQANPRIMESLSDPTFVRQLFDPNTIQAMLQMQGAFNGLGGMGTGAAGSGGTGASPLGSQPPSAFDLNSVMNAMALNQGAGAQANQLPLEQRFADQQQQLQDMGFTDVQTNLAALQATGGSVSDALDRLLNPP